MSASTTLPAAPLTIGDLDLDVPVVLAPMAGITNTAFRRLCREFGAGPLRQRDDHVARARRAHARVDAAHHAPRVRDAALDPALRRRPEDGRRGRHDARRRRPRRPHRPELRMPRAQGHAQGRGSGAAVEERPVPRHRRGRRAAPRATSRSPSRCARASTPTTSPTSRPGASPRAPASPRSRCTRAPRPSSTPARPTGRPSRSSSRPSRRVPVLGNGDIWSADDALRMVAETGCDGVVVGRGCLGRPWLFGDLAAAFRGESATAHPSLGEVAQTFRRHAELLTEFFDSEERGLPRHPQARRLVLQGLPGGRRAAGEARHRRVARAARRPARHARLVDAVPRRGRRGSARPCGHAQEPGAARRLARLAGARRATTAPRSSTPSSTRAAAEMRERLFGGYERRRRRTLAARGAHVAPQRLRARPGAAAPLERAAPARREDAGAEPHRRPRLRPQPAHPLARGRAGRPRARDEPRPRSRRRRHRVPRARPRPPAVRAQRRARAQHLGRRHRRVRGQRADAAPAHAARAQGVRRRRSQLRAQPHPGEPRRELQVPVARGDVASPTRAAARSSASTATTSPCSSGCAPGRPSGGSASRRR